LAPAFVLGVISLRGQIMPLFDIRSFFGLQSRDQKAQERVIVIEIDGCYVGILIDNIEGTIEIEQADVQPPLATIESRSLEYTKGHIQRGEKILIFLDMENILRSEEIESLKKGVRR
jgi:purine-binding chemotaxis protein CheW